MKILSKVVIAWVLTLSTGMAFAQTAKLTGTVLDAQGLAIVGASVVVEGTTYGASTGADGTFELRNLPPNANLSVSSIGYVPQTIAVGKREYIEIILSEDVKFLEEVVVVGYGIQKKVNLTGAISAVDAKVFKNRPITNSSQVLYGLQGVYVNTASAQPGADGATIRVRGQGTLNDNNPLVLVDGIEYPITALNPNDIESVTVLKDAASSAIYGARAANGVILVTTKKGEKGKFKTEYNGYVGVQQSSYLPDFVYDPIVFMEARNQAQRNEGKLKVDYSDALIEEYKQGMLTDPITYPQNNWLDIIYNDAFIQEHNVRFSGADERYAFSASLGYSDQDGVVRGTGANKYSIAIKTSAQINKRLKVGANINTQYKIYDQPVTGVSNLIQMTYKAQAFHPTYNADGEYADTFVRTPGHNIYRHPLALADEGENNFKIMNLLTNLSAEYKLPFNIVYNLNVGINKRDGYHSRFAPEVYEYNLKTGAKSQIVFDNNKIRHSFKEDTNNLSETVFNTLSWGKVFNVHHDVKLLLGASYQNDESSSFSGKIEGFLGNELHEPDAGSINPVVLGTSSRSSLASYFGRANYVLKDKYLFEANFRYDGSSRFASGNRWGFFPSFSAGWRLSEENFLKNATWIDNLKLRASWGQLGNEQIGLFRYVDLMELGVNYPLNGTIQPGAAVTSYNDPNITWETTTMANIGLDLTAFKGALDVSFELFDKRTSDILRQVVLPQQVGSLNGPIQNIGDVSNKGFELGATYRKNINNFYYSLMGNVTYVDNKIVSLKGQTIIDGKHILKEGEPIDSYYMLHCIGIFQSQEEIDNSPYQSATTKPGYLKFEDINKDGKITEEDRTLCGGVIPKLTYSFGFNLSYMNFDLNANFQGVAGVKTYGDMIGATPLWFGCGLPSQWLTEAWTPERGQSATLPILTTYEGAQDDIYRVNDFWLRDASYLRLKNVQLTYTVPLKRDLFVSGLKIFVNAQNLLTFSSMKDFDPEKNLKSDNYYAYPSTKIITGGINITF